MFLIKLPFEIEHAMYKEQGYKFLLTPKSKSGREHCALMIALTVYVSVDGLYHFRADHLLISGTRCKTLPACDITTARLKKPSLI